MSSTDVLYTHQILGGAVFPGNGENPFGVAYDPGTSNVFVAAYQGRAVSVVSDSLQQVVATAATGSAPEGVAVDSARHVVVVTSAGSDNVSVISDSNNTPLRSVGVGYTPIGVAYDPNMGELFVANYGSSNVSVVSDTSWKVTASIPVSSAPYGVAFDSGKNELFVTTDGTDVVNVIADSNDTIVANVTVGTSPTAVGYDPGHGRVYVANAGTNTVSVLSDATNGVVGTIPVGATPEGLAFDPSRGEVYVSNYYSGNVSVVNDSTDSPVASVGGIVYPYGIAFDSRTGTLYVGNGGGETLTEVDVAARTAGRTVAIGASPCCITLDTGLHSLVVADSVSGNVSWIDPVTGSVNGTVTLGQVPVAVSYDPTRGLTFVAEEYPGRVAVISDTGLQFVKNISLGPFFTPGGLAYDPTRGQTFVVNYGGANGSLIQDSNLTVVANILLHGYPAGAVYDPARDEFFVTNYVPDTVDVVNASNDSLATYVTLPSYSYPQGITYDALDHRVIVALSGLDELADISDANNSVVSYEPAGIGPISVAYADTFGQSIAANWISGDLTAVNVTRASPVADLPTGLTAESVVYDPTARVAYVANLGQGTISTVAWRAPGTYSVTFSEQGLPAGTTWGVRFNGTSQSTNGSSILLASGNGTFPFSVLPVAGYRATPGNATVTVAGANVDQLISFSVRGSGRTYAVEFNESGLAPGTSWSVVLNGTTHTTRNATISFNEPNGSYTFTVGAVAGYAANRTTGNVTVSGAKLTVAIGFRASPPRTYTVSFVERGLRAGTLWSVTIGGASSKSSSPLVRFDLVNGSYTYAVGAITGYRSTPTSGVAFIDGGNQTYNVSFSSSGNPGTPPSSTAGGTVGWLTGLWPVLLLAAATVVTVLAILAYRRRNRSKGSVSGSTSPPTNGPPATSDGSTPPPSTGG